MARETLLKEGEITIEQSRNVFRRGCDPVFLQHHSRDESIGRSCNGNPVEVLLDAEAFLHGIRQGSLTSAALEESTCRRCRRATGGVYSTESVEVDSASRVSSTCLVEFASTFARRQRRKSHSDGFADEFRLHIDLRQAMRQKIALDAMRPPPCRAPDGPFPVRGTANESSPCCPCRGTPPRAGFVGK